VSSILEALRELEGSKPSSSRSRIAWAAGTPQERSPLRRAAEALGIVAFGLGLGVAGFVLVLWLGPAREPEPAAPAASAPAATPRAPRGEPAAAAASQALPPAAAAPPAPRWLARMGPPRGRVDGEEQPAATTGGADAAPPRAAGLSLVRVHYSESRSERAATLRIDGSAIVLHEGETAEGIELQLVTPEGVYVRRGGEVLMLAPSR